MLYVSQIYCLKIILTLHFLRIPRGQVNYIYPKIICIYHAKLRNLYAGQEATVKNRYGTTDRFKLGKKYVKAVYCHPAYLTCMQNTSCKMLGWMKHKLESRLLGENINNLRYADDTTLMPESKELKNLLMKVKEGSEKVSLKLSIQKMKIMGSGPITSWQIDGK